MQSRPSRAADALVLREAAAEADRLKQQYSSPKLSKQELLRRTAGHVGLALPKEKIQTEPSAGLRSGDDMK